MENKKCYQEPCITVIRMDAQSDIIQTSGESPVVGLAALSNYSTDAKIINAISAANMFN